MGGIRLLSGLKPRFCRCTKCCCRAGFRRAAPSVRGRSSGKHELPSVGMGQTAELEVIYDMAEEATVEKEQVHPLPLVMDAAAALAADKG